MNNHLFLTGFMGSGKTTIGKSLAARLNLPVIDTDNYIETLKEKKIADIFQTEGERAFRDLETLTLKKLVEQPRTIITTGGGIIGRYENRELMKMNGTVIFLSCDLDEITKRLENDSSRPLFNKDTALNKKLYEERLPYYREASVVVETTNKSVEAIIAEIIQQTE